MEVSHAETRQQISNQVTDVFTESRHRVFHLEMLTGRTSFHHTAEDFNMRMGVTSCNQLCMFLEIAFFFFFCARNTTHFLMKMREQPRNIRNESSTRNKGASRTVVFVFFHVHCSSPTIFCERKETRDKTDIGEIAGHLVLYHFPNERLFKSHVGSFNRCNEKQREGMKRRKVVDSSDR